MFQDLSHSLHEGRKNVVGLQHTSKEFLSLQNTWENIEGFDELFNSTLIIHSGEIWGILLHDAIPMEKANEFENHLAFLYEHGASCKRAQVSATSRMVMASHHDYRGDLAASR
jgi:hypothetical protein